MELLYKHVLEQYKATSRLTIAPVVLLRLAGDDRLTYTFDKIWGFPGGSLNGDNFFTDICKYDKVSSERDIQVDIIGGVYVISGTDTDPDWLLYLWKYGRGEKIDGFVTSSEIPQLYQIYTKYGFDKMATVVYYYRKSWCNLY